ncbi:MAG: hypothetical protein KGD67_10450 [Candidatus Lokiarchaeota archaeon]|nr:hypothetical protein [Candidatus Lokiarchaeota archaeon]
MKAYTDVSRKTAGEDRIAICPNFGCEFITRVKPLKFGFLGFSKHPKCKKHNLPLVYIDERIGDFVDATLACFFDKAGLPPNDLFESVKSKFPQELEPFIQGWIYCITVGRGAPIVSRYMDMISNAYLKQLTKKQINVLKKGSGSKTSRIYKAIKSGLNEITNQYTRILKHLRIHSEILSHPKNLKPLSKSLRNYMNEWQNNISKYNEIIISSENEREMTLKEIKQNYDQILNVGICRCLLGLNPESKEIKKAKVSAFDRFSAYHDFYKEGLTVKFTKSDISHLCFEKVLMIPDSKNKIVFDDFNVTTVDKSSIINGNIDLNLTFTEELKAKYYFLLDPKLTNAFNEYKNHYKNLGQKAFPNFGTRYITKDFLNWLGKRENSEDLREICMLIMKRNELKNFIIDLIQTTNLNLTQIVEILEKLGLSFNRMTIKNVALKYIYEGDFGLYSKRFPRSLHRAENIILTDDLSEEYQIPEMDDSLIFTYNDTFRTSTKFINQMTRIIYNILKNNILKNGNDLFTENIEIEKEVKYHFQSKNFLNDLPINSPKFKKFLDKTIKGYVVIVNSLEIYNQNSKGEPIKLKKFAQELIKKNYNLGLSVSTLRNKILPDILTHLNSFTEFNLKALDKRILEQDENGKVCGYCGIKKPWSDYYILPDGGYISKCNKCTSLYGEIIKYRKKLRLLIELQHGKFKGKCSKSNCSTDISQLPAFDFHHPSDKKYSWTKVQKKRYQKIKELLEEDGVLPLCRNCHALKQQIVFVDYEKLILNKYLFKNKSGRHKTTIELNKSINEAILKHPHLKDRLEKDSQYIGHVKYMIKSWIRKRAITEQFYGGKCINCGETNLSSLTFHHVNPEKKKDISSEAFRKYSIKKLAIKIIQEECICLCANCHILIEATIFREHSEEIFRDVENKDKYVRKVNLFYEKFTKNIQNALNTLLNNSQGFQIIDYLDRESK